MRGEGLSGRGKLERRGEAERERGRRGGQRKLGGRERKRLDKARVSGGKRK